MKPPTQDKGEKKKYPFKNLKARTNKLYTRSAAPLFKKKKSVLLETKKFYGMHWKVIYIEEFTSTRNHPRNKKIKYVTHG